MIYNIRPIVLSAGIQNIVQAGLLYPINFLSSLYLIFTSKIRIKTTLDAIMALYIAAGILSFVVNIIPNLVLDVNMVIHSVKSFLVFMTVLVYYSGSRYSPAEFYKAGMWIIVPISMAILVHSLYLVTIGGISWYPARLMVTWASGWPQRWVMFVIIGFFYSISAMRGKIWPKFLALIFFSLIIISGTRSAFIGLFMGYFVFLIYSKNIKNIVIFMFFLVLLIVFVGMYLEEVTELFRFMEVMSVLDNETGTVDAESSIGYRLVVLWPNILKSIYSERFIFGWGHVGVSYLPEYMFYGTDIPIGEASAESQYFDVLQRQGVIGFIFFIIILFYGIYLSHKMSKRATGTKNHGFWIGSIAWQVAIFMHGVTVETVRYPPYSLFYFVFLGMLSYQYNNLEQSGSSKPG